MTVRERFYDKGLSSGWLLLQQILLITSTKEMKKFVLGLFALFLILSGFPQGPELVFFNGKIFTSDTHHLHAQALSISGGRISAVGTNAFILRSAGRNTKRIDLKGLLVVPGFNDAHNHLPDCYRGTELPLNPAAMDPSWSWIIDTVRQLTKITPRGQWILIPIGPGISNAHDYTRFQLDSVSPEHPVRLLSWMGHVAIFNSRGLTALGISTTAPDPVGGYYERMPDNKTLTGKAIEKNAYNPNTSYDKIASMRDEEKFVKKLRETTQSMLEWGITSCQNMCTAATPADFMKLWQKAGLPFRLRLIRWGDIDPDGHINVPGKNLPLKSKSLPLLTISGTKWLLDGTPDEEYAQQSEPYPDRPDWYGRMNYTIPQLRKIIADGIARKDQLMFHVVGDKTMGTLLQVMEETSTNWPPLRPRLEHADKIDYLPKYLEQAAKLGAIVVENPTNFSTDSPAIRRTSPFDMAMRTVLNSKIPLGIGSDGPMNPFLNIMFAISHPRRPSEAITREEAVIAYTATNAFAEFADTFKGTLSPGKVADFAVLSQDIFTIPIADLPATKSILTLVSGKIVYNAGVLTIK